MPDTKFNCSACGQSLEVDSSGAGLSVDCPTCNSQLTVPSSVVVRNKCEKSQVDSEMEATTAINLLKKAAEEGNATQQFNLGAWYHEGKNLSDALKWWHRAATQGNADAQYALAVAYYEKNGGTQNFVEAYKWAKLAAEQHFQNAETLRKILAEKMSQADNFAGWEQLNEAHQRSLAFSPSVEDHTKISKPRCERGLTACPPPLSLLESRIAGLGFVDFVGQGRIKARLELAISAAMKRGELLNHTLLIGPPGIGKATLVNIVANVMVKKLITTSGEGIWKSGDVAGLLTNLEEGDVLLIEGIDRLQKALQEYFYYAMRDFKLDIILDHGVNARSVRLNLPHFTLIATTARRERLPNNLLSCFPIIECMESYSVADLAAIARGFTKSLSLKIKDEAIDRIARSADGTPSDVLVRLRHIRDYAHVKTSSEIVTAEIAIAALKLLASVEPAAERASGRLAIPSEVRREVWRRDGGKCVKCGSRERLEYDHIIPDSRGGSNTVRNIELLCEDCNRAKRDSIQ